jgi:non-haem Fe2+, alpha-ketoglutarate-dependent halogenase
MTYREQFDAQGFMGPFRVLSTDEVADLKQSIQIESQEFASRNPYPPQNKIMLDQHLYLPSLLPLVTHEQIVSRLRAAIGDNVLCWRSSWFPKGPGDAGTDWHQAERFHEFSGVAKLVPTEPCEFFELTAWVAFTDSTRENGCLQIVPGSHRRWFYDETASLEYKAEAPKIKDGEARSFYGYDTDRAKRDPNWRPSPEEIVDLVMEPGEVVVFTSRCLHASRPNITKQSLRLGLAMRYCASHVKVYEGVESFSFFGEVFPTANHQCLLVHGEPIYKGNRVMFPSSLKRDLLLL